MTPCPRTNELLEYVWILVASRFKDDVRTYGLFFLSDHYHALLRDLLGGPASRLSAYMRDMNSLLARGLNAQHRRGGALWASGSFSSVEVHGDETELDQLLYLMAQPVEAGLTATAEAWPGVKVLPEDIGTTRVAHRPQSAFFGGRRSPQQLLAASLWRAELRERDRRSRGLQRSHRRSRRRSRTIARDRRRRAEKAQREADQASTSSLPATVRYTIPVPRVLEPLLASGGLPAVHRALRRLHDANVARIVAERSAAGLGFLGPEAILRVDPLSSAGDEVPDFDTNPRIACRDVAERLSLYEGLQIWRISHREGVDLLLSDAPWRARFPHGTHLRARELARLLLARGPPRAA